MSVSSVVNSKRYPEFIREHPVFKRLRTVKKVFPKIGLKNCSVSVSSIDRDADDSLKRKKIVFASDGIKGLWDIATMSERGILSCQSWECYGRADRYSHRNALIGSMVDPYAGIIYAAGRKMRGGKEMLYRSVVRLVVNNKTKKPAILLERLYVSDNSDCMYLEEEMMTEIFAKFIQKKSGLPVVSVRKRGYAIPLSAPVASLKKNCVSYRDSKVPYKKIRKTKSVAKYLV